VKSPPGFLSHFSREQGKGQGGATRQRGHLLTARTISPSRAASLMVCSNTQGLANSTGKFYAPDFSALPPPVFLGGWGKTFKDKALMKKKGQSF